MAIDCARLSKHLKSLLRALLLRTLDKKIARLALIFNLVLILHATHPPSQKGILS